MKKNIEGYIRWLNDRRAAKKRALSLLLAMSVAVSGNVFWMMHGIGTALTDDAICGIEEHTHTDECYEKKLICENTDAEHIHDENCYKDILICGIAEHTHTADCYIAPEVRHETPSVWEETIPELGTEVSENLVAVAVSQSGYTEESDGYTRYGDWYGNPAGTWNVMFISFCLHYAGIEDSTIPYGSGCWAWQVKLTESGLLITDNEDYLIGDIVLFDDDGDGKCDKAGIIADISEDELTLIEGAVDGKVDTVICKISENKPFGYVSVNALNDKEEISVPDESPEETEDETVVEYNAETESGIQVVAKAKEGVFPENTIMTVSDVEDEDAISMASDSAPEGYEVTGALAVDITFENEDGEEIEPADGSSVDVSISIPEDMRLEGDGYALFHLNEDTAECIEDADVTESEAVFTTDGFSIYVVTALGERDKDAVHEYLDGFGLPKTPDGQYVPNSEGRPYIIREGESIRLIGESDNPNISIEIDYGFGNPGCVSISQSSDPAVPTDNNRYRITRVINGVGSGTAKLVLRNNGNVIDEFYIRVDALSQMTRDLDFNNPDLSNYRTADTAMQVYVGDVINLRGYTYLNNEFTFLDNNGNPISYEQASIKMVQVDRIDNCDPNDPSAFIQSFLVCGNVDGTSGDAMYRSSPIGVKIGNDRIVYFSVNERSMLDHADIEIADNGLYTNSRLYAEEGVLKKKVTEYQSYVRDVNSCDLYKSTDDTVPTTIYYGLPEDYGNASMGLHPNISHSFESSNYWHNPDILPGSTQYELTSKYQRNSAGNYINISRKQFFYSDVDHAVFDVQLELRPQRESTYTMVNGVWVKDAAADAHYTYEYSTVDNSVISCTRTVGSVTESVDLASVTSHMNSVTFRLDHQDVIDALNKCPLNNGLDFTIQANSAFVEFSANKKLLGRELQTGEFTFGLFKNADCSGTAEQTATNDANGLVSFSGIRFMEDDTYTYYMTEIAGSDPNIYYDPVTYKIVIKVENLIADIVSFERTDDGSNWNNADKFEFSNSVKFTLPETGGCGLVPIMASGVILIGGALLLLMPRRRKEVDV